MWIRTQKKDAVIDVVVINVKKVGKKWSLFGTFKGANSITSGGMIIADYDTYDEAMEELSNFENEITVNPSGVYQFK